MEDRGSIDLVRYGVLWQKVESYEHKFDDMQKKIDKMEGQLENLVGMAERSKGSLWALMGVASVAGGLISYITEFFVRK